VGGGGGNQMECDKGGGIILLADNTGSRTVMLRTIVFLWPEAWVSAGFLSYANT